jgi:hypothetical protein
VDTGLDVGKEIIRKMARVLGHPIPASEKNSRGIMMHTIWQTHGIDEVNKGECGPQIKKFLLDVITN